MKAAAALTVLMLLTVPMALAQEVGETRSSYVRWKNGPSSDETFFPIAVWLQNPK